MSPGDVVNFTSTTELDILQQKHPAPIPPSPSLLLRSDHLLLLEDVELTGSHILLSARRIQGGAGPGGCNACHWFDVLLRYDALGAKLRDIVAAFAY